VQDLAMMAPAARTLITLWGSQWHYRKSEMKVISAAIAPDLPGHPWKETKLLRIARFKDGQSLYWDRYGSKLLASAHFMH
jgi:hypothetical protein